MDMKVAKKKLALKEKYRLLTRDLGWEPSYQKKDDIYPYIKYEGIKIHDWDKWEDPFRLTMDSYWKYQAEKERKFYAIIDAHAQNNGHLNVTDARYINTIKLFISGISPLEYVAHRGFAHACRAFQFASASKAPGSGDVENVGVAADVRRERCVRRGQLDDFQRCSVKNLLS